MSEWADHASAVAASDVDKMIYTVVGIQFDFARKGDPFIPFAAVMRHDREIRVNMAFSSDPPDTREFVTRHAAAAAIHSLWQSLHSRAGDLRAGAVLESSGASPGDRRYGEVRVMRLVGDHREATPFVATIAWVWEPERARQPTLGPISIDSGRIALFNHPQLGSARG